MTKAEAVEQFTEILTQALAELRADAELRAAADEAQVAALSLVAVAVEAVRESETAQAAAGELVGVLTDGGTRAAAVLEQYATRAMPLLPHLLGGRQA